MNRFVFVIRSDEGFLIASDSVEWSEPIADDGDELFDDYLQFDDQQIARDYIERIFSPGERQRLHINIDCFEKEEQ